jgi:gluconolactonase
MDLARVPIRQLATGFRFTEGPVVHANGDISFTDIFDNHIHRLHPDASVDLLAKVGWPNGQALGADGHLYVCLGVDRALGRLEDDGSISHVVTHYDGKRLNSPNDVVLGPNGCLYFTDPAWAIKPEQMEQEGTGVYMLSAGGALTRVESGLTYPNGLAFSPDGTQLYVSNSKPEAERALYVYDVWDDGTLSEGRALAWMHSEQPEVPDGLKVHPSGVTFCTGPGGVWLFLPGGEHVGTLVAPEVPANCAFSADYATLFLTARTSVYAADVSGLALDEASYA